METLKGAFPTTPRSTKSDHSLTPSSATTASSGRDVSSWRDRPLSDIFEGYHVSTHTTFVDLVPKASGARRRSSSWDGTMDPDYQEPAPVTTLMLHGVPSRRGVKAMMHIFAELGFGDECFDFLYMPLRSRHDSALRTSNFGFLFMNCATPAIATALAKAVKHHPLGRDGKSEKVYCSAAVAQGFAKNAARCGTGPIVPGCSTAFVRRDGVWHEHPVE